MNFEESNILKSDRLPSRIKNYDENGITTLAHHGDANYHKITLLCI